MDANAKTTLKLLIDVDPGAGDALAVALALFDPNVELVATTAVGGIVPPTVAARNLQRLVAILDPPKRPKFGAQRLDAAFPPVADLARSSDFADFNDVPFPSFKRRAPLDAAKIVCDVVRERPGQVAILTLGPLGNVARAFRLDPETPYLTRRVIIAGGTVRRPGNATPSAEFNVYRDPEAARIVLRAPCPKTLVPLDASRFLRLPFCELLDALTGETNDVSAPTFGKTTAAVPPVERLLRALALSALRDGRRSGSEHICLKDVLAYFAFAAPRLFSTFEAFVDVETRGKLTRGATVVDRTPPSKRRRDVDVVRRVADLDAIRQKTLDGLRRVARNAPPPARDAAYIN